MTNFPTRHFSLFSLLFFVPSPPLAAFELLSFMQIDNQFYLRLAQCQAKCAEKYGTFSAVRSLDGNSRPFFNLSSPLVELCHVGCLDSDIPPTISQQQIGTDQHPSALAFRQGQLFFRQTAPGNPFFASAPTAELQIHRVRPLCSQKLSSPEGLLKSTPYRAMMAIDMAKESGRRTEKPLRFVIQWRRKVRRTDEALAAAAAEEEQLEEPKWITASIEFDLTFHVTGIRAGHLHQFSVQLVSPLGPIGSPVQSHWIDFDAIAEQFGLEGPLGRISLQFFARYNMDNGVAALVRWRRDGETQKKRDGEQTQKGVLHSRLKRHHRRFRAFSASSTQFKRDQTEHAAEEVHELRAVSEFRTMDGDDATEGQFGLKTSANSPIAFPSCRLQIEWTNKSTKTVDEFELDGSDGFLLRHLAFNSEYSVRLLPSNLSSAHSSSLSSWSSLHGTFLSMHCSQVYGSGSLECDPEPVRELKVVPSVENGSALVSWERPEELGNILLYEVTIEPASEVNPGEQCEVKPSAQIVSALKQSNSVLFSLPQSAICEFLVQVVVYDLLGRDTTSQQRFSFIPLGVTLWSPPSPMEFLAHLDGSVLALLSVVVFVPMAAMMTLICTFSRQNTQRKAIRQKLPGGGEIRRKTPEGTEKKKRTKQQKIKGEKGKDKTEEEEQRRKAKSKQCNSPQSTLSTESSVIGSTSLTTTPQGTENGQFIATQREKQHSEMMGPIGRMDSWWTDQKQTKTEPNDAIV